MLGWHISVFRQADGGGSPATAATAGETRVAVWQTGLGGVDWIEELVRAGKAIKLLGNGYPNQYTAIAENLLPLIVDGPPRARTPWLSGDSDILTDKWEGKTVIDRPVVAQCRPREWLLVVAWDES